MSQPATSPSINHHQPFRIQLGNTQPLTLQHGQRIGLTVIKHLMGENWLVGVEGKVIRAMSNIPLQRGQKLRATVNVEDGQIVLRHHDTRAASDPKSHGIQSSTQQLVHAMLRSGLSPNPALMKRLLPIIKEITQEKRIKNVKRSHKEAHNKGAEKLRLFTIAYQKGLLLNRSQLTYLSELSSANRKAINRSQHKLGTQPKVETIAQSLKQTVQENSSHTTSVFPLFNHIANGEDHWLILPFSLPSVYGGGHLRVRLVGHPPKVSDVVVAIQEEHYCWYLHIAQFNSDRSTATIYIPDSTRSARLLSNLPELQKEMQKFGLHTISIVQDSVDFDGFGLHATSHHQVVDINI